MAKLKRKSSGRRSTVVVIFVALISFVLLDGCLLVGPGERNRVAVISSGDSFGECPGYCVTELRVSEGMTTFEARGWDIGTTLPTVRDTSKTDAAFWSYIYSLASQAQLDTMQRVYGCPDCADGGAEWIDIFLTDDDSSRVTFEYRHPPTSIRALTDTLRSVRREYRDALLFPNGT